MDPAAMASAWMVETAPAERWEVMAGAGSWVVAGGGGGGDDSGKGCVDDGGGGGSDGGGGSGGGGGAAVVPGRPHMTTVEASLRRDRCPFAETGSLRGDRLTAMFS